MWRFFLISILVVAAIGLWSAGRVTQTGGGSAWFSAFLTPEAPSLRVGLVAGHRGNDSGTVCPDGLTEASVNLKIAEQVAVTLRSQGIEVDLFDEFDPDLRDYRANAFISIHADSCSADLSGFKVAAPAGGSEASARLAECLRTRYAEKTSLPEHPNTITDNMLRYHAFAKIAPTTPGGDYRSRFFEQRSGLSDPILACGGCGDRGGRELFSAGASVAPNPLIAEHVPQHQCMDDLFHRRTVVGEDRCVGWRRGNADVRCDAAGDLGQQRRVESGEVGLEIR